jgi:hypothetical protein
MVHSAVPTLGLQAWLKHLDAVAFVDEAGDLVVAMMVTAHHTG